MTPEEQKRFVTQLSATVTKEILDNITAGRIPADWDGHELRQLLADRFAESTAKMDRGRMREYNNTVLVNNL